jgi:hypothetical protein
MRSLTLKTVEVRKKEKTEIWNAIEVGGKIFRISNYLARKLEYNYKPYIEFYCLYIPEKSLILTKEERDRMLIAPASSLIYPYEYEVIAKDDKNMIVLLRNDYDYIAIIENKLIPLPRSGRRLEEDIDLRPVEIYITNGEVFRKGYRMTLIPADYEVYPKENIVYIAKAEIIDESYKYDENFHRLIPIKKHVYLIYRNREYLMIRKKDEASLIHSSIYSDNYRTIKFEEQVEVSDEVLFEILVRFRNSCYFYLNNVISYSNPERMNFYKHSILPITLATKSRVAKATTIYGNKEKIEILIPGDRKILFIHGTYPRSSKENVFYTIHSEKVKIHEDDPSLILSYNAKRTIDITDLEDEEIIIKKWKYEITEEEGENVYVIDAVDEIKARVIGVIEERRVKMSDFLKEFVPYEIKKDCKIEEENVMEGIRTHEKHKITIPAF